MFPVADPFERGPNSERLSGGQAWCQSRPLGLDGQTLYSGYYH